MANEVVMPRLGWTMEAGTLVEWLKSDGDEVEAGELLFAVETDKAVQEVEALDSGVLRIPADSPIGIEKPVGFTLAFIVKPGESAPASVSGGTAGPIEAVEIAAIAAVPVASNGNGRHEAATISPRARRVAQELGVEWTSLRGSGSSGRIREADIRAAASARPAPQERRASPAVRRLAEEAGISIAQTPASKPAGRVTRSDVLAATSIPAALAPDETPTPFSTTRRLIAQHMTESARTVAPVTLTTEADATELAAIRGHLKAEITGEGEIVPSYTDLIIRLTALALVKHPALNATWTDAGIIHHAAVNIGVAVDAERGLLAPVIRDADKKSAYAIAQESAALIKQARSGAINPANLKGGGFTISNLGMFEIDAFTPIINLPEAAILGLGRIVAKPVVIDEETETVAVRKMIALSLTFDHRVVDGAPAARFLQQIKRMIERPYAWLTR